MVNVVFPVELAITTWVFRVSGVATVDVDLGIGRRAVVQRKAVAAGRRIQRVQTARSEVQHTDSVVRRCLHASECRFRMSRIESDRPDEFRCPNWPGAPELVAIANPLAKTGGDAIATTKSI